MTADDEIKILTAFGDKVSIEQEDYWPPDTYRESFNYAYGALNIDGMITMEKMTFHKATHTVTVRYQAHAPVDWVHRRLRELVEEWLQK